MIICGIDDAGRGSLIGPLVIAGVSIKKSNLQKLRSIGVKDSKQLTAKKREELYSKIIRLCHNYHVSKIYPKTIDYNVFRHDLNNLEAKHMAKVISELSPSTAYVDSCDVNAQRFGKLISQLSKKKVKSYHHADTKFIIVSAASIVAKVTRDRAISRLQRYHDLGSGYPSDVKTTDFVRNYVVINKKIPSFVRASWKPVRQLVLSNSFLQPLLHDLYHRGLNQ